MTSRLITPPTGLAVSLDDARLNLREPDASLNPLIEAWLRGIIEHAEHYTGRSFMNQTWRVTLDRFPEAIRLPHPPVISVTSVKYIDSNGGEQTLDPQDYMVDKISEPGFIVPAPGKAWPSTAERINAVNVEYVCGYGATGAATPPAIRAYLLAKLAEQFDPAVRPEKDTVQSSFIDRLLDRYVIWEM